MNAPPNPRSGRSSRPRAGAPPVAPAVPLCLPVLGVEPVGGEPAKGRINRKGEERSPRIAQDPVPGRLPPTVRGMRSAEEVLLTASRWGEGVMPRDSPELRMGGLSRGFSIQLC